MGDDDGDDARLLLVLPSYRGRDDERSAEDECASDDEADEPLRVSLDDCCPAAAVR